MSLWILASVLLAASPSRAIGFQEKISPAFEPAAIPALPRAAVAPESPPTNISGLTTPLADLSETPVPAASLDPDSQAETTPEQSDAAAAAEIPTASAGLTRPGERTSPALNEAAGRLERLRSELRRDEDSPALRIVSGPTLRALARHPVAPLLKWIIRKSPASKIIPLDSKEAGTYLDETLKALNEGRTKPRYYHVNGRIHARVDLDRGKRFIATYVDLTPRGTPSVNDARLRRLADSRLYKLRIKSPPKDLSAFAAQGIRLRLGAAMKAAGLEPPAKPFRPARPKFTYRSVAALTMMILGYGDYFLFPIIARSALPPGTRGEIALAVYLCAHLLSGAGVLLGGLATLTWFKHLIRTSWSVSKDRLRRHAL